MLITDRPIYKRIARHVRDFNEAQDTKAHQITKSRYAALRTIAELYINETRRVVALPSWADSDQLPTIRTNRTELSKLIKCSGRSVYNHIQLLIRAGILVKDLHGRQNDFELQLHPWFVFGDNFEAPTIQNLQKFVATTKPLLLHGWQNLPPISSYETQESSIISTNSGVETVDLVDKAEFRASYPQLPRCDSDNTGNTGKEVSNTPPQGKFPETSNDTGKTGGAPASPRTLGDRAAERLGIPRHDKEGRTGATTGGVRPAEAPTSPPDELKTKKMELTQALWEYIQPQMWPDEYFSPQHTSRILNLLWRDVFGHFNHVDTIPAAVDAYQRTLQQLNLAIAYARKNHWTGFLPPVLYFSREQYRKEVKNNQRGSFFWAAKWLEEADSRRQRRIQNDHLTRAIHSILAKKAPRGLKGGGVMTQTQLYTYWRNRLRRFNNSELLDRFDTQVLTHFKPS